MFAALEQKLARYRELEQQLYDPAIATNPAGVPATSSGGKRTLARRRGGGPRPCRRSVLPQDERRVGAMTAMGAGIGATAPGDSEGDG